MAETVNYEFKPGDDIVFLGENGIEEAEVVSVRIDHNITGVAIRYEIRRSTLNIHIPANRVFKDKKELIKSL